MKIETKDVIKVENKKVNNGKKLEKKEKQKIVTVTDQEINEIYNRIKNFLLKDEKLSFFSIINNYLNLNNRDTISNGGKNVILNYSVNFNTDENIEINLKEVIKANYLLFKIKFGKGVGEFINLLNFCFLINGGEDILPNFDFYKNFHDYSFLEEVIGLYYKNRIFFKNNIKVNLLLRNALFYEDVFFGKKIEDFLSIEENKIFKYFRLHPEKIKDFLKNIKYFLNDKDGSIDWDKVGFYFGVLDGKIILSKDFTKQVLEEDLGQDIFKYIYKDNKEDHIVSIGNEYIFLRNKIESDNLEEKKIIFLCVLGKEKLVNKSGSLDWKFFEKELEKQGLSKDKIDDIKKDVGKFYRFYSEKFEQYLNSEINLPEDVKNFYRAWFDNVDNLKKYWSLQVSLPLFSDKVKNLGKKVNNKFLNNDGSVNVNFLDSPKNIFDYINLRSSEKQFIKEYIDWQIKEGKGNIDELKILKEKILQLENGVGVFFDSIKKQLRDNIINKIFSDQILENKLGKDKIEKLKKISDKIFDNFARKNFSELMKEAEENNMRIFDYLFKTFLNDLVKQLKENDFSDDEIIEIFSYLRANKENLFNTFENIVININMSKDMFNKFKDNEFIKKVIKIFEENKNEIGQVKNYASVMYIYYWDTNGNKQQTIQKTLEYIKNKEKLDENKNKEKIEQLEQQLGKLYDLFENNKIFPSKEEIMKKREKLKKQLEGIRGHFNQEFDEKVEETLRNYNLNLANEYEKRIEREEEQIKKEIGVTKEDFVEKIQNYIKQTNGEKPVWTYPEYDGGNYKVVLYFPKKNDEKDFKEVTIEAPSIVELNKKLLKQWINFQGLNGISIDIISPDIFKEKFGKDINKLFTPQDIQDINKVFAKYLIEKIEKNREVRSYIMSEHENLYKNIIFNPIEGISYFISNFNNNEKFRQMIYQILPSKFVNDGVFDISSLPNFTSKRRIDKFFEEKRDNFGLSFWGKTRKFFQKVFS